MANPTSINLGGTSAPNLIGALDNIRQMNIDKQQAFNNLVNVGVGYVDMQTKGALDKFKGQLDRVGTTEEWNSQANQDYITKAREQLSGWVTEADLTKAIEERPVTIAAAEERNARITEANNRRHDEEAVTRLLNVKDAMKPEDFRTAVNNTEWKTATGAQFFPNMDRVEADAAFKRNMEINRYNLDLAKEANDYSLKQRGLDINEFNAATNRGELDLARAKFELESRPEQQVGALLGIYGGGEVSGGNATPKGNIFTAESPGHNVVNGGSRLNADGMSARDVLNWQNKNRHADGNSKAFGTFQVMHDTMKEAINKGHVPADMKMTKQNQVDYIGSYLFFNKRPAMAAYLRGNGELTNKVITDAAMEWEGFQDYDGKGYYDKQNGRSKPRAKVPPQQIAATFKRGREAYLAAKKNGSSDKQAEIAASRVMLDYTPQGNGNAPMRQANPISSALANAKQSDLQPNSVRSKMTSREADLLNIAEAIGVNRDAYQRMNNKTRAEVDDRIFKISNAANKLKDEVYGDRNTSLATAMNKWVAKNGDSKDGNRGHVADVSAVVEALTGNDKKLNKQVANQMKSPAVRDALKGFNVKNLPSSIITEAADEVLISIKADQERGKAVPDIGSNDSYADIGRRFKSALQEVQSRKNAEYKVGFERLVRDSI